MRQAILAAILALGVAAPAFAGPTNPDATQPVAPGELGIAQGMGWQGVDANGNVVLPYVVTVSGSNSDIDAGEFVSAAAQTAFISAADELRVKVGGNAADIYSGAGAQEILLTGLDANWDPISESILLMGAAVSAKTTQQFLRLNSACVTFAGTYSASNTGAITIETEAGTTVGIIPAEGGCMSQAAYSVPDDYTAYIRSVNVSADNEASTAAQWEWSLMVNENADDTTTPFIGSHAVLYAEIASAQKLDLDSMVKVPERSDIWVQGNEATVSKTMSATISIYLVPSTTVAPTPSPTPRPTPTQTPTPT